jgi:hypothetical protein
MPEDNDLTPRPNVGTAVIRTVVPYLTAYVIARATEAGFDLDPNEVSGVIVLVGGSLWYTVASALERHNPAFGWLLGSPNPPKYDK